MAVSKSSPKSGELVFYDNPKAIRISLISKVINQAIAHCQITVRNARPLPISRRIDATAATHGVYSSENTRMLAAHSGVIA